MVFTLLSLRALPLVLSFASAVSALALPETLARQEVPFTWDGCYADNVGGVRAMTSGSFADDSMTVESCALFCGKSKFFGLEYGRECYCADAKPPASTIAQATDCSFLCAGNDAEKCGAGNMLDVYTNNAYTGRSHAQIDGIPYLGCFKDGHPRVLPSKIITATDMTAEK